MKKLTSKEIRESWINFFKEKNHFYLESASLIPNQDPSLLWINSGVAGLKKYFLGILQPPSKRIVNVQKSIRTNDIENIGITARHHSFFEMLGNFSLGDYFKSEAIRLAYEFLTSKLEMNPDDLYITYFREDVEALEEWKKLGFPEERLIPGDRKTNFWDVGSGPCGPNTEIFFDRGEKYDSRGKELLENDIENDRFIEIWNIVFSEFNNDGENNYAPLQTKNIDTGAGLERLAAVLQNAPTNFDTDLFLPIIREIEKHCGHTYEVENYFKKDVWQTHINKQFKIIADHLRAVCHAIADGVTPSNVSRGYIIRRLTRRAMFSAKELGVSLKKPFLYKLVKVVSEITFYTFDAPKVEKILKDEEKKFIQTMTRGEELLQKTIQEIRGETKEFPAKIAFTLYETHGFPIEVTQEIISNYGFWLNEEAIEELKRAHSEVSRTKKSSASAGFVNSLQIVDGLVSDFVGYEKLSCKAKILFLLDSETKITASDGEEKVYLILDKTPFYATSGGQHADKGFIRQGENDLEVLDVFKDRFGNHVHKLKGKINSFDEVECFVDQNTRVAHARNHSATHLLFSVLRDELNIELRQEGSDITDERLTFDFVLDYKPSEQQIRKIEEKVNSHILANKKRHYVLSTLEEAKKNNVIITSEEDFYSDVVRVVEFEDITKDLCGGTHVERSGDIEIFKITGCQSKGLNKFRITALTSFERARKFFAQDLEQRYTRDVFSLIRKTDFSPTEAEAVRVACCKTPSTNQEYLEALAFLRTIQTHLYAMMREKRAQKKTFSTTIECQEYGRMEVCTNFNVNVDLLRETTILLRSRKPHALFILSAKTEPRCMIMIASLTYPCRTIFKGLQEVVKDLKGGGSEALAQGSFVDPDFEEKAHEFFKKYAKTRNRSWK